MLTVLVLGSLVVVAAYPSTANQLENAFGNLSSYVSGYVGQQIQSSGTTSQTTAAASSSTSTSTFGESTMEQTSTLGTQQGISIDSQWVASFISAVNGQRSGNLTENGQLDQFAALRFKTLASNYQISHYNFDQDFNSFFAGQTISVTEEYFFPNTGAVAYAHYIQGSFSAHWQGLVDPTYSHYGYYIGSGQVISRYGPCSAPVEIEGSINQTQMLIQDGCKFTVTNQTYLVIELGG